MSELYSVLLMWAVTLSGYQPPPQPLEVVMVSHSFLEQKACRAKPCEALTWYPETGGRKVYLDNRLNPETSIIDASFVVREFVHYLQWSAGRMDGVDDCESELKLDQEAYVTQKKFLAVNGVRFTMGNSILSARCA